MKLLLFGVILFISRPAFAIDESPLEKTFNSSIYQYKESIKSKTRWGLTLEVGRLIGLSGQTCSMNSLEYMTNVGTAVFVSIKRVSHDKKSSYLINSNDIFFKAWTKLTTHQSFMGGVDNECVLNANKLREVYLESNSRINLKKMEKIKEISIQSTFI